MVLQNYQNLIEITSNMIYIAAFGVCLKCLHKIHLNTQWGRDYVPRIFRPFYGPGPQEEKLKEVLLARPQLPGNYDQCQLSRTMMMLMNQIIPAAINTYLPTSN